MGNRVHFQDIRFGFASAEVESSEEPQLLLGGFLDPHGIIPEVLGGRKYLVLGRKGSGKSAVGLHLALLSKQRHDLFVSHRFLGDLSYKNLSQIVKGEVEPELRYPRAWAWLLLLCALDSFTRDNGAQPKDEAAFHRTVSLLRTQGFLPVSDLATVVGRTAVRGVELKILGVGGSVDTEKEPEVVSLAVLVQHLRELLASTRSPSRHLIIIDGLDDVLLDPSVQLHAISALVLESARLNQFFRENECPLKIVILCRTDIYERLPGPNQNKLRQDLAIELRWYEEATSPRRTTLVKLANARARLYDPSIRDVFSEYFSSGRIENKEPVSYLLEFTRHTPRDFVQLLRCIQDVSTGDEVQFQDIRTATRTFADSYFLPEIRDELDGVIPRQDVDRFLEVLRQFHRAEFFEQELRGFMASSGSDDLERILHALYGCGAIGNRYIPPRGMARVAFKYRNPGTTFNRRDQIIVHRAIKRALAL